MPPFISVPYGQSDVVFDTIQKGALFTKKYVCVCFSIVNVCFHSFREVWGGKILILAEIKWSYLDFKSRFEPVTKPEPTKEFKEIEAMK